jgi:DNA polymerase-4
MRDKGRTGRTVILRMRFADFERATRSTTLPRPTAASQTVAKALRALLAAEEQLVRDRGLTLLGVTMTNLARDDGQLELPLDRASGAATAVDAAVDRIRERFGTEALQRAALLRDRPEQPWLRPDED